MMLEFLYKTLPGRIILKLLVNPQISVLCGRFLDSPLSKVLIKPFVRKNHIDLSLFYSSDFRCFNDCFMRKIRPEFRKFDECSEAFSAPCDGLLSVYDVTDDLVIPVKGSSYSISRLLHSKKLASYYDGGYCLVYRLCVDNYHRYSYLDNGTKGDNHFIQGKLHTVRPIALYHVPVFTENSREYTVMKTEHFGKIVQMEVGAMLVGKIVNHHERCDFARGEEKGYFMYGGSTIIVLARKDKVCVDERFIDATRAGHESPVIMGEKIGYSIRKTPV